MIGLIARLAQRLLQINCVFHMSQMLDCPKLPNTYFFQTDVHKKATFQLSEEEWNRIKPFPSQPTQL
jgi:hypothetical protein